MLPTGKKRNNQAGFTFVELVVVVGIFAIMLLFAVPLFRQINLTEGTTRSLAQFVSLIETLKQEAVIKNTTFVLHIDVQTGKVYTTDPSMDEEALMAAERKSVSFDDDLELRNLEFPEDESRSSDDTTIRFFSKGFSDRALIHVREDDQERTVKISMFQQKVRLIDKYVSYDDCI